MGSCNTEYLCFNCWNVFLESVAYCDERNMLCPECKTNLFYDIDEVEIKELINKLKELEKEIKALFCIIKSFDFIATIEESNIIEKLKKRYGTELQE